MEDIRYPEQFLEYRPIERRRRPGQPSERLPEEYNREAERCYLQAKYHERSSSSNGKGKVKLSLCFN